jgi:SAM-dependent methyltransferase
MQSVSVRQPPAKRSSLPVHRDEEYDPGGFDALAEMQQRHFWYRGRHRFLLAALNRQLAAAKHSLDAIDLGGGCGGWIGYLQQHAPGRFRELALADSSPKALNMARRIVGEDVGLYQADLLDLGWRERWDVAFLLDVLEHLPDDAAAMRQVFAALRPGGLALVTTPALRCFWSYNDVLVKHVRRYSRRDFVELAKSTGFTLRDARYFMFLLSPLLVGSRLLAPNVERMSQAQIREHLLKTHRVPAPIVNRLLQAVFALETPLGHIVRFPWGTSVLGVFEKPRSHASSMDRS